MSHSKSSTAFGKVGSSSWRKETHKRCIINWVNSIVPSELALSSLSDLFTSPLALVALLEHVSGSVIPGVIRVPQTPYEHDRNFRVALGFLEQNDINTGKNEYFSLVQHGEQGLLGLLWAVANHFVIYPQFSAGAWSKHQPDVVKESNSSETFIREEWIRGAKDWTLEKTSSLLPGLQLQDLSSGFSDGSVLLAIIAQAWPEAGVDWEGIRASESVEESVEVAMSVAEQRWGVRRILDARSVTCGEAEECLLLYLAGMASKLPPANASAPSRSDPPEAIQAADHDTSAPLQDTVDAIDEHDMPAEGEKGDVSQAHRQSSGGDARWPKLPWLIREKQEGQPATDGIRMQEETARDASDVQGVAGLAKVLAAGDPGMERVLAVIDDIGADEDQAGEEEVEYGYGYGFGSGGTRGHVGGTRGKAPDEKESEGPQLPAGIYKSLELTEVEEIQRMLRGAEGRRSVSELSGRDAADSAESDDDYADADGGGGATRPSPQRQTVDVESTLTQRGRGQPSSGEESSGSEMATRRTVQHQTIRDDKEEAREERGHLPLPPHATVGTLNAKKASSTPPARGQKAPVLASTIVSAAGGGRAEVPWCVRCCGVLDRPRLLDCLHMCCLPCLQPLVRRPTCQEDAGTHVSEPFVVCPSCQLRTFVPGGDAEALDPDEGASAVLSMLKGRQQQPCDNCLSAPPSVWCPTCQAALCSPCSSELHSFSFTRENRHHTVPIEDAAQHRQRPSTCPLHPAETLAFLSISHQQLICKECVLSGKHDKHRYVLVEEAGAQARDDLVEAHDQMKAKAAHIEKTLEEVRRTKKDVDDAFNAKMELVSGRTEELLEALRVKSELAEHEVTARRDEKLRMLQDHSQRMVNKAKAIRQAALMMRVLAVNSNPMQALRFSDVQHRMISALSAVATQIDDEDAVGPPPRSGKAAPTAPVSTIDRGSAPAEHPPRSILKSSSSHDSTKESSSRPTAVRTSRTQTETHGGASGSHSTDAAMGGSARPRSTRAVETSPPGPFFALAPDQPAGRRLRWVGSLHALGGFDGKSNTASMERLEDGTHRWTSCQSLLGPRRGLAAASYQGRIFVVGGWDGREYLDTSHVFDTATDSWIEGKRMLTPRCFAGCAVVQRKLYVVGGYFGATNLASAEAMDLETGEWEALPSMAVPRRGLGVGAVAGRLVVAVGGWNGKENVTAVEALDTVSRSWHPLPPLQVPRCSLSCAVVDNRLFALGGWDGAQYLSSVESIDLGSSSSWRMEPPMRTPRSYAAATKTTLEGGADGGIVVMGGWDGVSSERLETVEYLDVRGSAHAWTQLTPMQSARYGGALVVA